MPQIEIAGLWKLFGRQPKLASDALKAGADPEQVQERYGCHAAVRAVDLSIEAGEIFVVMGLSGSGKSTLLRMLNGLISPSAGKVIVEGQQLSAMRPVQLRQLRRNTMAMVFQSFALLPGRSALENAAFGLEVAGVPRAQRLERARSALERVGLGGDLNKRPEELSGGMQQRVGLARALALNPPILLMDEAFSALDPLIRREMQDLLLDLQRDQRRTVVFISHDLDEAIRLGDRIALMQDGSVLQCGSSRELLCHPANERVRHFFRDVDASSVLSVDAIAVTAPWMVQHKDVDKLRDQPPRAGSGVAYVLDEAQRFCGLMPAGGSFIPADQVEQLAAGTSLKEAMEPIARTAHPVPVVSADGQLLGVLSSRQLLRAMVMA